MAGKPMNGRPRDLHKQCKAKSKRSGKQCKNPAMIGKEVCRMHGGKSPSGPDAGNYKHGAYSKVLPERLLATFAEALDDPEFLSNREEIALLKSRVMDLIKRVDSGESGRHWRDAKDAMKQFKIARASKDTVNMNRYLGELETIINRGVSDYAAWDEVSKAVAQRRRLVESERKRRVEQGQVIALNEAIVLIDNIMRIITEVVSDPVMLSRLSDRLQALLASSEALAIIEGEYVDNEQEYAKLESGK